MNYAITDTSLELIAEALERAGGSSNSALVKDLWRLKPIKVAVDPMTEVADRYAHRMALELECVLSDGAYSNRWYKSAMQVLSEYRSAMHAIHEQHSPTFMGEPLLKEST